jgi:hypothetical protein
MSTQKSVPNSTRISPCFFEEGQAAVEFLLVLLLLILVIFGGFEISRGVAIRQALDSGCAASVRVLSLNPSDSTFAEEIVQSSVEQNIMGSKPTSTIQIYDAAGNLRNAAWLSGSTFGTSFILEGSAPYQADIPFLPKTLLTIRVRHWGTVERYP